jgi:hypothetical protein
MQLLGIEGSQEKYAGPEKAEVAAARGRPRRASSRERSGPPQPGEAGRLASYLRSIDL